jgi:hypothetical protein
VTDNRNQQSWAQQNDLIYVGFIGIGIVLVQPFLTSGPLDISATICVVSFALALPLLAILVMVNQLEGSTGTYTYSRTVGIGKGVGVLGASVGVVSAFWHMHWLAGVAILAGGIAGLTVYTATYRRLYRATLSG